MISDDRLHKTRFCKNGGANQNFPHKQGGWSKRGGGLERFCILKGGLAKKRGMTFLRGGGGGSYPGAHYGNTVRWMPT